MSEMWTFWRACKKGVRVTLVLVLVLLLVSRKIRVGVTLRVEVSLPPVGLGTIRTCLMYVSCPLLAVGAPPAEL